jgi:hypothetical protein
MKHRLIPVVLVAALAVVGLASCQVQPPAGSSASSPAPASVLPVDANPIVNASTAPGLTITTAVVEDNVDPSTNAPIADRLQLTLKNTTANDLTHVEIYYSMKDSTTNAVENYYQDLTGLVLPAGVETTIYFDNMSGPGHFPENQFSVYRSSTNEVVFTIEVSADGVKPATATATKAVGTGEVPGE